MRARGHFSTHEEWQQAPVQEIHVRHRILSPDGGRTPWEETPSIHLTRFAQAVVYFGEEAAAAVAEEAGPDSGAGSRRPASAGAGAPDEVARRRARFPDLCVQMRRRSRSRNRA